MPLLCPPEVATALNSVDQLRALHEASPIDLDMPYSATISDIWDPSHALEDTENPRLIFACARAGRAEVVRFIGERLIKEGRSPHTQNRFGDTPCSSAASSGHESCIRALDELGADPNQANNDGATPCIIAAQLGHESCVRALVELGAGTNQAASDGATPCIIAAWAGHELLSLIHISEPTRPH